MELLTSDGQQFHQYQQHEQSPLNSDGQQHEQSPLNSDGQQFHQYQQHEQSHLNSDGQQHQRLEAIVHFVDIGGIVDHHCFEAIFQILVELLIITV
jgi:hypothetical protein